MKIKENDEKSVIQIQSKLDLKFLTYLESIQFKIKMLKLHLFLVLFLFDRSILT